MLTNWVLHGAWALSLLPFGFAGRESPYLLLLPARAPSTCRRTSRIAHYVIAVQSCALSDHSGKATSIGQHFVLILASYKIVGDEAPFLGTSLLVPLISVVSTSSSLILPLALNIDWRLWSYSILGRCRAWFLGVTSLLGNHLAIESMLSLIARHVATEQIIVLLSQTEGVWWRTIDIVATLFC